MFSLIDIADGDRNVIRDLWDRLDGYPGGHRLFSRLIGRAAPYSGTIRSHVHELRTGYARLTMRDRPGLRNHLQSVHAIALANLAEFTGNLALAYSMPDDARFIVAGMNLDYLKKARGTLTGTCDCPTIESSERKEYAVPVVIKNEAGDVCVEATLRTLIGPKKRAAEAS